MVRHVLARAKLLILACSALTLLGTGSAQIGPVLNEIMGDLDNVSGSVPESSSDTLQDGVSASQERATPGSVAGQLPVKVTRQGNTAVTDLKRLKPEMQGYLFRACGCAEGTVFDEGLDAAAMARLREVSNVFMSDGVVPSPHGLSNMVWAFGQFLDHDLVGLVDNVDGEHYSIPLDHPGETVTMSLARLVARRDGESECRVPLTVTTPQLDAGPVYSPVDAFLQSTLREPNSCKLRVTKSDGGRDHLPLTSTPDNGRVFFIAGDVRVNEHAVLTAMHTVFLREHNRICDAIPANLGQCTADSTTPSSDVNNKGNGGWGGWWGTGSRQGSNRADSAATRSPFSSWNPFAAPKSGSAACATLNRVPEKRAEMQRDYLRSYGDVLGPGGGRYKTRCACGETFTLLTNDEKFDLARQVVTAKLQHITLNEFLPALKIPKADVARHKPEHKFPDISVEFAAAGYRVGHDMIPDHMGHIVTKELFGGERYLLESKDVDDTGRRPKPDHVLDDLLSAVARNPSNKVDGKFSDTIRNVLFGAQPGSMFGEDLATRSLFRGHDMGLVGYQLECMQDMAQCFGAKAEVTGMEGQVDAPFVLMLADNKHPDRQVLGDTLQCMLRDQFHRVLLGEGGQYYSADELGPFFDEVKSTTMAKVINANTGAKVPANAFRV